MNKKAVSRQCNRRALKKGFYRTSAANNSLNWDDDDVEWDDDGFWEDHTGQRELGDTTSIEWFDQSIDRNQRRRPAWQVIERHKEDLWLKKQLEDVVLFRTTRRRKRAK